MALMHGELEKRSMGKNLSTRALLSTTGVASWKARYIVIFPNEVRWYPKAEVDAEGNATISKKPLGFLSIGPDSVLDKNVDAEVGKPFSFSLQQSEKSPLKLVMRAKDEGARGDWTRKLAEVLDDLKAKSTPTSEAAPILETVPEPTRTSTRSSTRERGASMGMVAAEGGAEGGRTRSSSSFSAGQFVQNVVSATVDGVQKAGDTIKNLSSRRSSRSSMDGKIKEVVKQATALNESFQWAEARALLQPYAEAKDVGVRVALVNSCLFLADGAIEAKRTQEAKDLALEGLAHATAAKEIGPTSARAHAWYGQMVQIKAKAIDGQMEQGRVLTTTIANWEKAHELDPKDPLPLHLLGSTASELSKLPWVASKALRSMAPGLKAYTTEDALQTCLKSEEVMPTPPEQYSVTNCKIIGQALLKKGDKEQAKAWLSKAVNIGATLNAKLDPTARKALDEATKSLATLK